MDFKRCDIMMSISKCVEYIFECLLNPKSLGHETWINDVEDWNQRSDIF